MLRQLFSAAISQSAGSFLQGISLPLGGSGEGSHILGREAVESICIVGGGPTYCCCAQAAKKLWMLLGMLVSWMFDLIVCESSKGQALPPDLSYRQSAWAIFAGDFRWCEAVVQWSRLIAYFFLNI